MGQVRKRILLTAAVLCAAGCAKSQYEVMGQNRGDMRQVRDSAMANAPEEKPPKILPETHFAAGLLFERQGQFDKAIPQYLKAVALNHNYVAAFHRLGLLQSATRQHIEAVQSLQRAVALRPDNAVLRNDLGFELMRAEQWDQAESELRRAIELQPDLATAHINLALVQAKSERFTESLASFQAVLPEPDAYYNLGLMYRGQQRYSEAIQTFRHVLTIAPEFSAAKVQIEELSARTESPTPAESVAEAAKFEPTHDDTPVIGDGEDAVAPKHEWGTTFADLASILSVIDGDAHKDCDPPADRPMVDDEVVEQRSGEGFADRPTPGEFVEGESVDSKPAAVAHVQVQVPGEDELLMPSNIWPTDDAVAATGEFEGDVPAAAEFVEEPLVGAGTTSEPQAQARGLEGREAQARRLRSGFGQVDADEVIATPPPIAITDPIGIRDSWAMLEELEEKVALLRYETQIVRAEKAGFGDLTFRHDVLTTPITWIEQEEPAPRAGSDPASGEEEFDDFDVPSVEIEEDDADESDAPEPSDAMEEGPRKDPAPSDRTSLWTIPFGELDSLLSIVRNESICWDDLHARTQGGFPMTDAHGSGVLGIGQEALTQTDEFSPAILNDADRSMEAFNRELSAGWAGDGSGDAYGTYQGGQKPFPD